MSRLSKARYAFAVIHDAGPDGITLRELDGGWVRAVCQGCHPDLFEILKGDGA
jgi:hypothetical protein